MPKKDGPRARRPARLAQKGEVYTFRLPRGFYGACQVTRVDGEGAETVALDYLAMRPPSIEDVPRMVVSRPRWGGWQGDPARCNVQRRVPWWLECVGRVEPIETFEDECLSYGGWQHAFVEYDGRRWDELATSSPRADSGPIDIDLGGGARAVERGLVTIAVGPNEILRPPPRGPVDFEALDALPNLQEIAFAGADPGFLDYVRRRRLTTVDWRGFGAVTIDLRGSDVEFLTLTLGSEPVRLLASPVLRSLTLKGAFERLTLEGASLAAPFQFELHGPQLLPPPAGAEDVEQVEYVGLLDAEASALASYTRLAALTLRGAPGKLLRATALVSLTALRELTIEELYELDAEHWPADWPVLDAVTIRGLRQADAATLKAKLASVPSVELTGARSDEWIAATLENPFRSWEADNRAFGRAACAAWKKAKEATQELARKEPAAARAYAGAEAILAKFVRTLNELDAKFDIDSQRRDEAAEAFFGLARELSIEDAQASEWLDEWRNF